MAAENESTKEREFQRRDHVRIKDESAAVANTKGGRVRLAGLRAVVISVHAGGVLKVQVDHPDLEKCRPILGIEDVDFVHGGNGTLMIAFHGSRVERLAALAEDENGGVS